MNSKAPHHPSSVANPGVEGSGAQITAASLVLSGRMAPIFSGTTTIGEVLELLQNSWLSSPRQSNASNDNHDNDDSDTVRYDFSYGVFVKNATACLHIDLALLLANSLDTNQRHVPLRELARQEIVLLRAETNLNDAAHQITLSGLPALPVALGAGVYALLTATQVLEVQAASAAARRETAQVLDERLNSLTRTLRAPLAAIECQCELIRWQFAQSAYLQEKQKRIRTSCHEIEQALSRFVTDQITPTNSHAISPGGTPIHLARYLNKLAAELQAIASNKGVAMVLDVSTPIQAIFDGQKLRHTIVQLVSDYVETSPAQTSLTVMSSFESDDTEIGVNGEQSGSWRLIITGSRRSKTLSLDGNLLASQDLSTQDSHKSLAATAMSHALEATVNQLRNVITLHGGDVNVEISDEMTSFMMSLPHATLTAPDVLTHHKLVLVVDDDVELQELLCITLERYGYRVIGVNDGFDALIAIERYRPDIVVTDVIMPNMDGLDLTARIKQSAVGLPVILVTGYYKDLAALKQRDFSPDMILPKPLEPDKIVAAIEALTAKRHLSLLKSE